MRREKGKPALWRRIEEELAAEIIDGKMEAGVRLPAEPELMSRFGVGRHTLRQAMAGLETKGLIRIEQGRGTFVNDGVVHYQISNRTRFSENLARQGKKPLLKVLSIDLCKSAPKSSFEKKIEAPLYRLKGVSFADGVVICICNEYFPVSIFQNLDKIYKNYNSTTKILKVYGIDDYVRDVTRISSRLPSAEEARRLQQPRSQPVLVTQKIDTDLGGRPISFSEAVWSADRVEFVVDGSDAFSPATDAQL